MAGPMEGMASVVSLTISISPPCIYTYHI
jgi:hypothetical protein